MSPLDTPSSLLVAVSMRIIPFPRSDPYPSATFSSAGIFTPFSWLGFEEVLRVVYYFFFSFKCFLSFFPLVCSDSVLYFGSHNLCGDYASYWM